jgi:sugar phosphate isomerase/epimerase
MKRREFVNKSAFLAAGLLSLPSCIKASSGIGPLGLQLYALRDSLPKDPKGVLRRVADFGYKELETFSYADGQIFGMPFADFGSYVKDLGMEVTSGHYSLDVATSGKWEKAVDDAKSIDQKYMVIAYLDASIRKSLDDYKSICKKLNAAGAVCNDKGIRFGYHNHAFEFERIDGEIPFDVMLSEVDPKYVGMEMDIYWVVRGGADPLQYFEKYPGRFEQWHVKDMDKNNKDKNANVGAGTIDFKQIFTKAKQSGMKHWYVEHDTYPAAPIDSVQADAAYLKTLQ